MNSARAVAILTRQMELIDQLQRLDSGNQAFTKWQRDTEVAIQRIFGEASRHFIDFTTISYSLSAFFVDTPDYEFQRAYLHGLERARAILASLIDEILEYDLDYENESAATDVLSLVERICLRFHGVARQLRSRHAKRGTLEIEDEYDVQDLLHALLRLHFDDIRPEEWSPTYAGGASRMDFLLKKERVVIEVKKTRQSLSDADLGAELLVDIARYQRHPDCGTLVCFIYDPEGRIGNATGLERDLESHGGPLKVRAIVGPKSY
ncbi:hypothetical protein [Chitinimonas sp.]|uniref:PD-(D/E)XK nuclease domain-containing protein n=1 Tax=Chitinimonas sp. TaxID=1934313 RepID=UPI0035AE216F